MVTKKLVKSRYISIGALVLMAGCSKSAQNGHEGGVILEAEETCDALLACVAEQVAEEIP